MTIRRMKTYTAQTGYVYQYYFVGKREAFPDAPESPASEYVFDVTRDRSALYAVSIFLRTDALFAWAQAHGRGLTDAEQYAAAKLRLLRGFDEVPDITAGPRRLLISSENIEELLADLNLE
jgi:hypothetical protein